MAFRRWRPGKLLDVLQCIGQRPAPRGVIWPQVAVAGPACVWLRQEHVAQSCAVSAGGGAGQPELRTRLLVPAGPAWKRLLLLLIDDPSPPTSELGGYVAATKARRELAKKPRVAERKGCTLGKVDGS